MNAYGVSIHNHPKREPTFTSFNRGRQMKKLSHPYNGMLCNTSEQTTDTYNNLDESQRHYAM